MPGRPATSPLCQGLGEHFTHKASQRQSAGWTRTRKPSSHPLREVQKEEQLPCCLLRGQAGRELPTLKSQPKGQGQRQHQEKVAHFSAWETEPISVTGSTLEESTRPMLESQLCL